MTCGKKNVPEEEARGILQLEIDRSPIRIFFSQDFVHLSLLSYQYEYITIIICNTKILLLLLFQNTVKAIQNDVVIQQDGSNY